MIISAIYLDRRVDGIVDFYWGLCAARGSRGRLHRFVRRVQEQPSGLHMLGDEIQ